MSSPLDGRIRKLAREEVTTLLDSIKSPSAEMTAVAKPVQAGELQQQITDLHEHLHHAATTISRLEARVDALEKAAGQTDQQQRPAGRRTARKDAGE
ncbi:MAG TPA: hypothetical protein VLB29_07385 [Nocardioidaceae bacterium]|nr:hypothetical protein [Nocardioidaceae bacterium]